MIVCMQDFPEKLRHELILLLLSAPGICVNLEGMAGMTASEYAAHDVAKVLESFVRNHSDLMQAASKGKVEEVKELCGSSSINLDSLHEKRFKSFDGCC